MSDILKDPKRPVGPLTELVVDEYINGVWGGAICTGCWAPLPGVNWKVGDVTGITQAKVIRAAAPKADLLCATCKMPAGCVG